MSECDLIKKFLSARRALENYKYGVEVMQNGFYIRNEKGTFVADCQTVDGVMACFQMIEYTKNQPSYE